MTTHGNRKTHTTSSSSIESVKNSENRKCFCGRRARIYTSWTLNNPGRRFYTCYTPQVNVIKFIVVNYMILEIFFDEICMLNDKRDVDAPILSGWMKISAGDHWK